MHVRVVQLWDVHDPTHAHPLGLLPTRDMDVVYSVAFSPSGHTLASGDFDGTVRLWDVRDPQHAHALKAPFIGHTNRVMSVAFSPDGTTLASASFDHTIRLWDVSTGSSVPLTGHTGWVYSVAFSPPDGHTLASGSADRTIRFWDFDKVMVLQGRACHIANRNLTRQEWREYLGVGPYQKTCPALPWR